MPEHWNPFPVILLSELIHYILKSKDEEIIKINYNEMQIKHK